MTVTAPNEEGVLDPSSFSADVEIDQHNLNHGFLRQAALFAYYASLHVHAMRAESRLKLMMEIEEARVDKGIRDRSVAAEAAFAVATEAGEKPNKVVKLTEKQVEQEIARTPSFIKAANAYNNAKANTALAHVAVESFRQRRDMLIQLGANQREELKGDLRMNGGAGIGTTGSPLAEEMKSELRRQAA